MFEAGAINNQLARLLLRDVVWRAFSNMLHVLLSANGGGKDKVPQILRRSRCKDMMIRGFRKELRCTLGSRQS